MSSSIRFDFSDLNEGLDRMLKADAALGMYCNTKAQEFERYAKTNRPWTDRTNMARQTLKGSSQKMPFGWRIQLAHGVDYGVWLELAHEKRFAIVEPTIRLQSPNVIKGMNTLFNNLVKG